MKKIYVIILGFFVLFSCKKEVKVIPKTYSNNILVLKIDYETNKFEGAVELPFQDLDEFTISYKSTPANDSGGVQLYYNEFNKVIFNGSIWWSGSGKRFFPKINSMNCYDTLENHIPIPSDSIFQKVSFQGFFNPDSVSNSTIWSSVSNLKIVEKYRESNPNGKIHIFSYTPSIVFLPIMKERMEFYIFIKN